MKRDRLILLLTIMVLATLSIFLAWVGQETASADMEKKIVAPDSLDTDRQLIDIRLDSLLTVMVNLQRQNPEVFSLADQGSALRLNCRENQRAAFNRILLNDASLETFATIKNTQLAIDIDRYELTLPIQKAGEVRYVTMPVDILQSVLLSTP